MPESGLILPPDSSGKATRTNTQTTPFTAGTGGEVHQQVVALGDPVTTANLVRVGSEGQLSVSPTSVAKLAAGKVYVAGRAVTIAGSITGGAFPVFQALNPSTSGKVLYVLKVVIYSSVAQQMQYVEGATIATPTAITPRNLNRASTATSAMVLQTGNGWSGGTKWDNESRVSPNSAGTTVDMSNAPMIIPPGRSLALGATSTDAQVTTVNFYYYEE